jgi:hypothetical protein
MRIRPSYLVVASAILAAVGSYNFASGSAPQAPGQAASVAPLTRQAAAPAATVVATAPYQITADASCTTTVCRAFFPLVAANRRLDIKFVSCTATGNNTTLQLFTAYLGINNALFTTPRHALTWNVRDAGSTRSGEISQPVVFTVSGNQRPNVGFTHTGPVLGVECSISGDLVFLS